MRISVIDRVSEKESQAHSIPARIETDSGVASAPVQKYFQTQIQNSDNSEQITASFRGRGIKGKEIEFPHGYECFVVDEFKKPLAEDVTRKFHVMKRFKKVTYWNWDQNVSGNDPINRISDWINIAEELHDTSTNSS